MSSNTPSMNSNLAPALPIQSSVPFSSTNPTLEPTVGGMNVIKHEQGAEGITHPLESEENETSQKGKITPPVPMVHLRALIISGESHVFTFEPETTVWRMKELIWSMWPSSWTSPTQPPSPSFLRILHAGRILGDDSTLASNGLPAVLAPTTPTVIHVSVRSFSIRAEEDSKKTSNVEPVVGARRGRDEEVRSGCGCIIM